MNARKWFGVLVVAMAIVKEIVDSCGGRISVDTQLGRGSTFEVRLPMLGSALPDE